MTLRITPNVQAYEDLYQELLDSIPAGTQWHKGPVILPLSSSDPTPFLIEGDAGDVVEVFNNNALVRTVVLTEPSIQIDLQLLPGKNFLQVRTSGETFLLLVVAANYATLLRGYAQDFFFNVDVKFQDAQNQLNSELSLRATEHQISFQEMLPPTRAMRVLAGKIAVRSLINETGSTRGVDDIVTAASNTTPVVRPTTVDLEYFEPDSRTLYSTAHDEGGFAFHVWIPNICIGSWAAFVKLMDNLEPSIAELTSVSDELVSLKFMGRPESHTFDFDTDSCSIVSLLSQDCLPIVVSVDLTIESEIAFCAWRYPFDTVVELALGRLRLDSLAPFSEVIPAASFLVDVTGSETGLVGAAYYDLSNHIERIVSATTIESSGSSVIAAFHIPGSRRAVFPAGSPGWPVSVRYEGAISFDSGLPLDSAEEADPLTDGWYGLPLVDRFDGGHCLDSTVPDTSLFADLECCFSRPQATLAVASYWEMELPLTSSVTAGYYVIPGATGSEAVIDSAASDDVYSNTDQVFDG
jgi:hypothetical protein